MDRDELGNDVREQLHRVRFYENWRVSLLVGIVVGVIATVTLQGIF